MKEEATKNYIQIAGDYLKNISAREKVAIAAVILVVCVIGLLSAYDYVNSLFSAQKNEFAKIKGEISEATQLLKSYSDLEARRASIEAQYKKVEMHERPLSYLEKIAEEKAGISSNELKIDPRKVSEFGGGYEKAPFSLSFKTNDLEKLVAFLDELVNGPKPFLVSKLELRNMRVRNQRLDVDINVTSIRKKDL